MDMSLITKALLTPPPRPPRADDVIRTVLQNPLHSAIDLLRNVNQAMRATPAVKQEAEDMARMGACHHYLATWGTVRCAAGRNTGHTSYILEAAEPHDLVIVHADADIRHYRNCRARVIRLGGRQQHADVLRSCDPQTIYIDDVTRTMSDETLHMIYQVLGRRKEQTFILLG